MKCALLLLLGVLGSCAGRVPCEELQSCVPCVKDGECVHGLAKMEKGVSFNCFEKAEAVGGKLLGFVNNTHQCPEDDGIVAETTTTDKVAVAITIVMWATVFKHKTFPKKIDSELEKLERVLAADGRPPVPPRRVRFMDGHRSL